MIPLFLFLSVLSVISALCVVLFKNPIHSVLSLIVCFFTIAGHFLLLQSEFLAVVQIIVYAGAIMVLFLFILMLINLSKAPEPQPKFIFKVAVVLAVLAIFTILVVSMTSLLKGNFACPFLNVPVDKGNFVVTLKDLGKHLYSDYLMPFEFSSLLFLSALVGAVVISKKSKELS